VDYIGPRGLQDFDLVLSYTGGRTLDAMRERLGARRVATLYGSVDPAVHRPAPARAEYAADLSYLGTCSADRDAILRTLFVNAAQRLPSRRFVIGGAMYDASFPWQPNIKFVRHLPPADHPAFYCSSRLTLNVTRRPMAEMGFCPSARLFEAAACGVPVLSDVWEGLDQFLEPGREVLLAESTEQTIEALARGDLASIAAAARERTLACHTADIRARELEFILESTDVGNHPGCRQGQPYTAAGVL
jgi:spore maturation protein CgeB